MPSVPSLRKFALAAATSALFCAGTAAADPIDFLPAGVVIQFKYNNLETRVENEGDELTGIFNISSINDAGGNPYWAAGLSDGTQLTGSFTGLTVARIDSTDPDDIRIYFTGGVLNVYNVPNGSFAPTSPGDPLDGQICGGACPAPWLTMDFAAGIVPVDDPGTAFDETTTTLFSIVSSLTSPLTGTGDGLLELTGGTAASFFQDNVGTDFSLQSNLQSCPAPGTPLEGNCEFNNNTWPIASFDPVVGRTRAVPEPGTLALVGLGLLGLGALRRRV